MNNELNNNLGNQVPNNNQTLNNANANPATAQFQTAQPNPTQVAQAQPVNNIPIQQQVVQEPVIPQQPQPAAPNVGMNNANVGQVPQQPQMLNPGYPQQPSMNDMGQNNFNQPVNNGKKNNKTLFIVLAIIVVAVIAVIITFALPKKSNNNSQNEYDSDNGNNQNETVTTTDTDTMTYGGFKFKKISGYQYTTYNGLMVVSDNSKAMSLGVTGADFSAAAAQMEDIKSILLTNGAEEVKNAKIDTYNGIKIITYEVTLDGVFEFYYIAESPASGYVFEGEAFNRSYTIDYSTLDLVSKVIKNASLANGTFSASSSNIGIKITNPKVFE